MSPSTVARIPKVGRGIAQLYAQLAHDAFSNMERRWRITPDLHIFAHLCEHQIPDLKLNPRSFWTYADEDLVGCIVKMAET